MITDKVTTYIWRGGVVQAKLIWKETLARPEDEIPAAVTSYPVHMSEWVSVFTLSGWGTTEVEALTWLMGEMSRHPRLDVLQNPIAEAVQELEATNADTPWTLRDMGTRGPKPGRQRARWRVDGKRVNIYTDTLRAHSDPKCQCPLCVGAPTKEET